MFAWLLVTAALSAQSSVDNQRSAPPKQTESKLQGLSPTEADSLIRKLQEAQHKLRTGQKAYFELLYGAPASYQATETPPRRAFVDMSFERPWSIERKPTTGLWQPYELRYFPPGPHSLMWKVNVVLDQTGELARVEMLYTAPPPF